MKLRRITAAVMAGVMILSLCACESAEAGVTSGTTSEQAAITAETTKEATEAATKQEESAETTEAAETAESASETTTEAVEASTEPSETTTQTTQTAAATTAPVTETTAAVTAAVTTAETTKKPVTAATTAKTAETTAVTTAKKPAATTTTTTLPEGLPAQYEARSEGYEELYKQLCKEKDMPVINITTLDGKRILSKEEYVPSVIDVFNCDEELQLSATGGVRVRGNSTAEQGSEKPYRIKFDEKQNMLGLHDGHTYKNWVLLRSFWNLAPDFMGFTLAKAIFDGKYYSSDCTYVNVYINGKFAGFYLLCEQNQAAKDRVDIEEPKAEEKPNEIGYLLELDNYAGEDDPFFSIDLDRELTDIKGVTRKIERDDYSIKSDTTTQAQRDYIEKYLNGVIEIALSAVEDEKPLMLDKDCNVVSAEGVYSTPKEAVDAVIDLESLANMLILEELVHNNDVGAGSFYLAVDFSAESKYKKLTFMAPWDFNWGYEGSASGGYYACTFQQILMNYERSNYWFILLMKADWFQELVKAKWKQLSESGVLKTATAKVSDTVETLRDDLGENEWSVDCALDIVKFVNGRIKWLNKQWLE